MSTTSSPLKAFKCAPAPGLSQWYLGILMTNLAESKDTAGAFLLNEGMLAPGTEPPPHVHSREDEPMYVLDGEFDVYVGHEAFKVQAGECVFLPRFKPHAFVIRSPRLRILALLTPGGFEEALRGLSKPAQRLELPIGAATYSDADPEEVVRRFGEYGVRMLTSDEIAAQMPLYPKPAAPNPGK